MHHVETRISLDFTHDWTLSSNALSHHAIFDLQWGAVPPPLLPVEPQAALTPPCVVQAMALLPHSSVSPTSSPTGATMMRAQLLKVVFEADGPLGLYMKVCDEWLYNC